MTKLLLLLLFSALCLSAFGRGHVIDGKDVGSMTETPWQVSLKYKINKKHFCGGVLISKRVVLSAAHCVAVVKNDPTELFVAGGGDDTDIANQKELPTIKEIHVHPDYDGDPPSADIAVLVLEKEIEPRDGLSPILLPTRENVRINLEKNFSSVLFPIVAFGWGSTTIETITTAKILQSTGNLIPYASSDEKEVWTLPVINQYLRGFEHALGGHALVTKKKTGYSCAGDSGGPLVGYLDHPVLLGLTSFSTDSCITGIMFYENVQYHLDWIKIYLNPGPVVP